MKYLEADFTIDPYTDTNADILKALSAEGGFESFTDTSEGFKGYIQEPDFDESRLKTILNEYPLLFKFTYSIKQAEDKDWNETWEKEGFEPVFLGPDNAVVVHDSSHPVTVPVRYDILINPQLAFGTGTHETTGMLTEMLLKEDMEGLDILDMGCGTGILGIFCCLKGAEHVTGIDIDEWSVKNAAENALLNQVNERFTAIEGNAGSLVQRKKQFDVVIANINRNILLRDLPFYADAMKEKGAELFLSGFFKEDADSLIRKAANYGFKKEIENQKNNWCALKLYR